MTFIDMRFWALILLVLGSLAVSDAIENVTAPNKLVRRQALPDPLFPNWSFKNFNDDDTLNAVKVGLSDAIHLADLALQSLDCSPPSVAYERYFQTQYIQRVRDVYQTIIKECSTAGHNIQVFYSDNPAPDAPKLCGNANVGVYMVNVHDTQGTFNGLNIITCPQVFASWPEDLSRKPCSHLLLYATERSMVTVGSQILHELLHATSAGIAAQSPHELIDDLLIDWPASPTGRVKAYGPFFSHYLNVAPDISSQMATWNVENYVYYALETYYIRKCNVVAFIDPPEGNEAINRATDYIP